MFSAIAAFGIWPALPLTGYWLFARVHSSRARSEYPVVTYFCLMTVAGIAVWSVPMLASAIAGAYRAEYFGLLGWAVTLYALVELLRKRRDGRWQERLTLTPWDLVLAAGLIVAGGLYLAFPQDSILGGRDQGAYANHGIYIAHHGKLDVPHPWAPSYDSIFRESFEAYSGLYQTEPTMTMQFSHLFPVWLAQAFSTMGHYGLFRLNGVLALLFLLIFYGVCRLAVTKSYAVVATLFLGLNPSELWLARITLSEIPAQLFIWSGLLLLLSALKMGHSGLMRWAGIFLGFSALVRIDSLLLVPMLFLSHLAYKIVRGPTAEDSLSIWPVLYQTALPVFLLAVGYYAVFSSPYFDALSSHLEKIGFAALLALFALLATTPRVVKTVHPWLTGRAVLALVGSALLLLAVYAYWIRPNMVPYSMIAGPGHPLHGIRNYREDSLVNLTRYLSPLVVSTAIFGWFISLWMLMLKKQHLHLIVPLIIVAGFSGLYLWNPYVAPYHFWAIRRFIPVVIPGVVLCAAMGVEYIFRNLPERWALPALLVAMVFLAVFTVKADGLILGFAESGGYFVQLKQLAEKGQKNELALAQ